MESCVFYDRHSQDIIDFWPKNLAESIKTKARLLWAQEIPRKILKGRTRALWEHSRKDAAATIEDAPAEQQVICDRIGRCRCNRSCFVEDAIYEFMLKINLCADYSRTTTKDAVCHSDMHAIFEN